MAYHHVKQGECIASIADASRIAWERVWDHPSNAALKALRKRPGVLYPGDLVFVPDRDAVFPAATGKTHVFSTRREKVKIRLRMLDRGEPIVGAAYDLTVDGAPFPSGSTGGDGCVEASVPADAVEARVTFAALGRVIVMALGVLDPITETSGLKARLQQLGYHEGPVDRRADDALALALWGFQMSHGLTATGEPDDATRAALEKDYSM